MRKTLTYELRRNLIPLAVFCACALLIALFFVFTADLSRAYLHAETGEYVLDLRNSCIGTFTSILCVLCAVVPIMQFSYRMKQRSADLWYSLPIGRKKLTLVRLLGGLALVFVPYTLAYWLGVACVAMREPHFAFWAYLAFWMASVPLGAGLFCANAFIFTRGNTVADGVVFLVLWTVLLPCIIAVLFCDVALSREWTGQSIQDFYTYRGIDLAGFFFPYSPAGYVSTVFDAFARRETIGAFIRLSLFFVLPLAVIEGVGGCVGLFVCADRDRAEDAEQIGASWFGYRVLAPAYTFLLLASVGSLFGGSVLAGALLAVVSLAFFFAYRRSFRLKVPDLISYAAALVLGIAFAVLYINL